MKKKVLSAEGIKVLSLMATIESNEENKEVAMDKVISYAQSLQGNSYDDFINGLYELAYNKWIVASGNIVNDRYVFDKLRLSRRGKNFYLRYIKCNTYIPITKVEKKSLEELASAILKSDTFALTEKIITMIIAIVGCIIGVYSALK